MEQPEKLNSLIFPKNPIFRTIRLIYIVSTLKYIKKELREIGHKRVFINYEFTAFCSIVDLV